ncbi:hypothetical protein ADUPG1_007349, partial [Aduncisulcus paluster]
MVVYASRFEEEEVEEVEGEITIDNEEEERLRAEIRRMEREESVSMFEIGEITEPTPREDIRPQPTTRAERQEIRRRRQEEKDRREAEERREATDRGISLRQLRRERSQEERERRSRQQMVDEAEEERRRRRISREKRDKEKRKRKTELILYYPVCKQLQTKINLEKGCYNLWAWPGTDGGEIVEGRRARELRVKRWKKILNSFACICRELGIDCGRVDTLRGELERGMGADEEMKKIGRECELIIKEVGKEVEREGKEK